MSAVLEMKNVNLTLGGRRTLHDVSLRLEAGQTLGLIGASGSGKSTILNALLGLLPIESGTIEILGQRVEKLRELQWHPVRKQIGMVFQLGGLLDSLDVGSNVGFRELRRSDRQYGEVMAEVQEKLDFIGLGEMVRRLPGELSGGQKRRVAIARALMGNPQILFFDEPTTGLDPITAKTIVAHINAIRDRGGISSIIVTHELQYAYQMADAMVMLREGKVCFVGTVEEFIQSDDPYIVEFRTYEIGAHEKHAAGHATVV